jgi:uncharacterized membrane protein YuzA (DUF378 family)
MKTLYTVFAILGVVGAINWGLVGLFEFDLVAYLFGTMTSFSRLIYVLVGISGLGLAGFLPGILKKL